METTLPRKIMERYCRFSFKPVENSQEDMVLQWIKQPHINEWLHGDGLNNTIEDINKFVNGQSAWAKHWVAYDQNIPFAYLITSEIDDEEEDLGTTITLDLFICRLDYLGKGLAVKMIHEFLINQFSNVETVLIDPEMRNKRAVYVYQKAGFKIIGEFIAPWHPVPHYKMQLKVADLLAEKGLIDVRKSP